MNPVDVRPHPAPTWSGTSVLPYVLAAIAAVALAVAAAGMARGPAFVDQVDVVNRSSYELLVDVRTGPDDGWVRLGYVVDYADLHFGEFRPFLVFNVADAAITIGVLLLLVRALLMRDGKAPKKEVDHA